MENKDFLQEYRKTLVQQKVIFEAQLNEIKEKIAEIDRKMDHN